MKKTIVAAALCLLVLLTGCGGKTTADAALTVRIKDCSGAELSALAGSWSVNGETLGSANGEADGGKPGVFTFAFSDGVLPEGTFRLDVYAAGRPGEDYVPCGGAEIGAPERGGVYILTLYGDFAEGFYLSAEDGGIVVTAPDREGSP